MLPNLGSEMPCVQTGGVSGRESGKGQAGKKKEYKSWARVHETGIRNTMLVSTGCSGKDSSIGNSVLKQW